MNEQEVLNAMMLTRLGRFHTAQVVELYKRLGSATAVIEHRDDIRDVIPDASDYLVSALHDVEDHRKRAADELDYDRQHNIHPLVISDEAYPQRMKTCADAPLVVYYLGNANLNARRVINIIGTRRCTNYGIDIINEFVDDLMNICPDVLIFSGLAYGVDITAHRAALRDGLDTVGVLAHGLDEIYPRGHRDTAAQMVGQGGLLTEYMTHTQPFARNFVRRNRIVAGCSDATILVESAAKGGGLITCSISRSYGRDVFAFPGPVKAKYSVGCNNLIRDNGAALITSAIDFVRLMGWNDDERRQEAQKRGIEPDLFPDLSDDERAIVDALRAANDQQLNMLAAKTDLPISRLSSLLFEMEMKGIVKPLAGGNYHLIIK